MLNNDERSWIKLSLALNAALRAELAAIKRALITRGEHKHNPRWREQPRSPRGTPDGGQWVDGGGVKPRSGPKQRDPRPPRDPRDRVGGNRPPTDSLRQIFGVTPNTPAGAILTPLEPFLNLSGPGMLANEQATRNLSQTIIREIQSIDSNYRAPTSAEPGGFPTTIEGRNNLLAALRADRAVALYLVRGDPQALQVETLRIMQRAANGAYAEGVRLYNDGRLSARLSREEAIGNFVDGQVRTQLREHMRLFGISTAPGEPVRINNRAYRTMGSERSYRIPDARVADVAFDVTLTPKTLAQQQIRGIFGADFRPTAVVVVRPSQLGQQSTYLITRPRGN
ncbi:hypothetical protein U91I_01436 [alpha proteobacterium U9-1i]|nr:hypothetical protein U91I_01436 [alpha proteobacterium U9-1i]